LALALVLLVFVASGCGDRAPQEDAPIAGGGPPRWELYAPLGKVPHPARGLIVVADPDRGASIWEAMARAARADGWHVLHITARAHELSPGLANESICFDYAPDGPTHFVIMGESSMADVAAELARGAQNLRAVVIFSATSGPSSALDMYVGETGHTPLLLLAGEGDLGAATAATQLKARSRGYCEAQLYPGAARGADLLATAPSAVHHVLEWLRPLFEGQGAPARRVPDPV